MSVTTKKGVVNAKIETAEKMVEVIELTPAADAPAKKPRGEKTPQELLADIRAQKAPEANAIERSDGKTLNELMVERKQRNEEAYCDELRAQGKPIYTLNDVKALGYRPDPSWTQRDLQVRMLCGPVLIPLKNLQKRADEHHQNFVIPGRKAVVEIMVEVYSLFLVAMVPDRKDEVFRTIRGAVEAKLKKKLSQDVSYGSQFIRFVFTEFDDRKVHLYSKALDFAYSSNVSADDFRGWVEELGGWEKVRQAAAKAFTSSPDVQLEKLAKAAEERDAEALVQRWMMLQGVIDTVPVSAKLSKRLGRQPGHFLLEVTWIPDHHPSADVYGGHFEVMDVIPSSSEVKHVVQDIRVAEAKLDRAAFRQLVDRMDTEAYDALDDETKARYDQLEQVRAASTAQHEANGAARRKHQADTSTLTSFV
jgi:hypothetical protein